MAEFTIKHQAKNGDTAFFPAAWVRSANGKVEFDPGRGDDVWASFDSGTVYVMNAQGKTVDIFHLEIGSVG